MPAVIVGKARGRAVVPSGRTLMQGQKGMGVKKPMTALLKRMDNLMVDGSVKRVMPPLPAKGFLDLDLKKPIGRLF